MQNRMKFVSLDFSPDFMAVIMSKYIRWYAYELFPTLIFTVKRLRHCYLRHCYLKGAISQKLFIFSQRQTTKKYFVQV